ncbi:MAG: TraR/DksA C4-type zinc finger protein [Desulfobacula sp.]|nr:TraR/DksA C4-type zinc finger protein [Desulfobacula sp.]MDA8134385.1 TraR/DksA C4-type zinc finger protein [Desulfobacteraceae bacterium]
MDEKELEQFRKILTDLMDELETQSGQTVSELMLEQDREIEALAESAIQMNWAVTLRLRSRESRLIRKIKSALERIEDGTYGICEVCGNHISIKRLLARPVTSKCIECKEREEKMEGILS